MQLHSSDVISHYLVGMVSAKPTHRAAAMRVFAEPCRPLSHWLGPITNQRRSRLGAPVMPWYWPYCLTGSNCRLESKAGAERGGTHTQARRGWRAGAEGHRDTAFRFGGVWEVSTGRDDDITEATRCPLDHANHPRQRAATGCSGPAGSRIYSYAARTRAACRVSGPSRGRRPCVS